MVGCRPSGIYYHSILGVYYTDSEVGIYHGIRVVYRTLVYF